MSTGRYGFAAGVALFVLVGSGCSTDDGMVPIRGEVIYNGQPLTEGQVVYLPKDPSVGRQASGPIKSDGTFVLTTQRGGDGVAIGEYEIVVFGYGTNPASDSSKELTREEREALMKGKRPSSIPEKYSHQSTSGLSDTVDRDHSGFKRIELSD